MEVGYYHHPKTTTTTTKRKGRENANGDFSLASPARKIPRLDAYSRPIVEEDEQQVPIITFGHDYVPKEHVFANNASAGGLKIEELPSASENNDRAIVPYNPNANANPLSLAHSHFLVSINPQLVSGFKNQVLWSNDSGSWKLAKEHNALTKKDEEDSSSDNRSLAVVTWAPPQNRPEVSSEIENLEMVDADELERSDMEVENSVSFQHSNAYEADGYNKTSHSEGLYQWHQQQPYMILQSPNTLMTPIFL